MTAVRLRHMPHKYHGRMVLSGEAPSECISCRVGWSVLLAEDNITALRSLHYVDLQPWCPILTEWCAAHLQELHPEQAT